MKDCASEYMTGMHSFTPLIHDMKWRGLEILLFVIVMLYYKLLGLNLTGTSFGLTAGANTDPFQATPTSYDYDAPIR